MATAKPPFQLRRPLEAAAPPPPPSPLDVPTLELWLRADLGVTIATGVSQWLNQAPSPSHFTNPWTQATGTRQPTVVASDSGFNNQSTLAFDHTQIQFLETTIASGPATATWYFVLRVIADPPAVRKRSWLTGTVLSNYFLNGSNIFDDTGSTTRYSWNPTPVMTSMRLYRIVAKSGSWAATFDGAASFSSASNTVGWNATQRLGTDSTTTLNESWQGRLAEVIGVRSDTTGADHATLISYLNSRYSATWT